MHNQQQIVWKYYAFHALFCRVTHNGDIPSERSTRTGGRLTLTDMTERDPAELTADDAKPTLPPELAAQFAEDLAARTPEDRRATEQAESGPFRWHPRDRTITVMDEDGRPYEQEEWSGPGEPPWNPVHDMH